MIKNEQTEGNRNILLKAIGKRVGDPLKSEGEKNEILEAQSFQEL